MAVLGTPYRVMYESKNLLSGLTNVIAQVMKPNGSVAGVYSLTELSGFFAGIYYFDYTTLSTDPVGEYIVMVYSPSESVRAPCKITFAASSSDPWQTQTSAETTPGSFGDFVQNSLLTVNKFLGLK